MKCPTDGKQEFQTDSRACIHRYLSFASERKNPSLKETKRVIWIYERPVSLQTCRLYGRHTCKQYSLLAHKLDKSPYCLPMLWQSHHSQTTHSNYKPRIQTLGLCSSEPSKVCFQPLQMNSAASNLMLAGTWQGMF